MDWHRLESDLSELDRKHKDFYRSRHSFVDTLKRKVGHNGYTEQDLQRDVKAFYIEQYTTSLRVALRALQNECISAYPLMAAEERDTMRRMFRRYDLAGSGGLLEYIMECIEFLESPADEDIFRLALIALSIHDFHPDFRDTGAVLAELAIAAVRTRINMEPHCLKISELLGDGEPPWPSMKKCLETFHLTAPKRERIFDDDFMSYYEGTL
jgi:hypothetical protein